MHNYNDTRSVSRGAQLTSSIYTMPEEQESEELLSDIQDLALEGSMEAAIQLQTDVTSTPETESKLEGKFHEFPPS